VSSDSGDRRPEDDRQDEEKAEERDNERQCLDVVRARGLLLHEITPASSPVPCRRSNRRRRPFIGRYGESATFSPRAPPRHRRDLAVARERRESAPDRVCGQRRERERERTSTRTAVRRRPTSWALTCGDLVSRASVERGCRGHRRRASWQTFARGAAPVRTDRPQPAAENDETAVAPQHDGGPWPRTRSPGPWRVSPRSLAIDDRPIVRCPQAQDG